MTAHLTTAHGHRGATMSKPIKTKAPGKGDLVVGHKVYAFVGNDLPAIPCHVVAVSKSGHEVTVEVDGVLVALGLPRRTTWTWRRSVSAYQDKNAKTQRGHGLALVVGATA